MKTENKNSSTSSRSNTQEDERKGNRSQGDTSNRGFASMDEDDQREIASKGGKAAHEQGVAHEWTSEEAREAGRKGGQASHGSSSGEKSKSGSESYGSGRSSDSGSRESSRSDRDDDDNNKNNRNQSR